MPAPKDSQPLVSVVVPIYEVEPYLERCLDSILAQTHSQFELIAVNDGSTPEDVEILHRYSAKDSRIRVIHQENLGVGPARNAGVAAAQGEYLAFVDADDFVEPDFLSVMVGLAHETAAEVVVCNFRLHWGLCIAYPYFPLRRVGDGTTAAKVALQLLPLPPFAWTKLYRRDWFAAQGVEFPPIFYEDVATTVSLLSRAKVVAATRRAFYHYCLRATGITGNFGVRNVADYLRAAALVRRFLESEGLWVEWRRAYGRMRFFASWQLGAQIAFQDNTIRVADRLGLIRLAVKGFRSLGASVLPDDWQPAIDPSTYRTRTRGRDRRTRPADPNPR